MCDPFQLPPMPAALVRQLQIAAQHVPPPGTPQAGQVQAVLASVGSVLAEPHSVTHVIWAVSLLLQVQPHLTTVEHWRAWGNHAAMLLRLLARTYQDPD